MTHNPDAREAIDGRDMSGETVLGMRVAAYRETHPEHGDKYGHRYSEHWSTPNWKHPDVKVERLFTEADVRAALATPQPPADPGVLEEARFLLDRISELDWSLDRDDFARDWHGHVEPSLVRLDHLATGRFETGDG